MADSSNPSGAGMQNRVSALQARLDQLHRDIARERAAASRTVVFTLIAGVLVFGLLGWWFYFGYTKFTYATEPENVVNLLEQQIDDNLPKARSELESQVKQSAPKLVVDLSRQAQAQAPEAMKKISAMLLDQLEQATQEVMIMSEERFQSYLRANKALLDQTFTQMAKNQKGAQQALADAIEPSIEKEFGGDINVDAAGLCRDVASINANLKFLSDDRNIKNMTPKQRSGRKLLEIARALVLEGLKGVDTSSMLEGK